MAIVGQLLEDVAHAHVQQTQLTRQVRTVAIIEGFADVTGEALQVAQVGFDLQAQAQAVFTPEITEEVVDLAIEFEAIGTLGHRHQDVEADPGVQ